MNNKIFECFKSKELRQSESFDILEKQIIVKNIEDSLLEHPFVTSLTYNFDNKKTKFIIYRLNNYHNYPYIEYFLNDYEAINTESIINNYLKIISGRKIIKGNIYFNGTNYTIIQLRENANINNWVTLWDIIVYHKYYKCHIDDNTINFFIENNKIDNLFVSNKLCLKPIVLYCNINEKYRKYVEHHNSIQYCHNNDYDMLIYLNNNTNYNIRCVCFVDEEELNGTLKNKDFFIEKNNNEYYWIFKSEKNIRSYIK
jgi:hypothetical protein